MRRLSRLLAAALLLAQPALAQRVDRPGSAASIATGVAKLAPLTNILTWKPMGNSMADFATTTFTKVTGSPSLIVIEAPDDYDAVQLVFGSQTALDTYTIDQAVVSGSASYGQANKAPGVTPLNESLTAQTTMNPVTFNNNGNCNLSPWAGTPSSFTGLVPTSGATVFTLSLSAIALSGTNTLSAVSQGLLASNSYIDQSEQITPTVGMFVTSANGQIPANTKVGTSNGTTITLASAVTTTADMASGEQLFFSYLPIVLSQAVAASSNPVQQQMTCSDWVPASSFYRNDTVQVGDIVSVANFPVGTTVTAVGPQSATLSRPATSTTGGVSVSVAFTRAATLTQTAKATYGFKYYVNSTTGIRKGMIVSGSGVPANNSIAYIGSDANGPYVQTTIAPAADILSGVGLTFTATCWTYLTGGITTGDTVLNLVSTNSNPLLLIRVAATATGGNQVAAISYPNANLRLEGALGLRQWLATRTATVDDVNIIGNATNQTSSGNWPAIIYAVNFLTRHDGVQIDAYGDSQTAGLNTITGSANFTRLAGEALSRPEKPVAVANFGYSGQNFNQYGISAHLRATSAAKPSIMYMQAYSNNGRVDSLWSYQSKMQSVRNDVKSYGGRIIVGTQATWGTRLPGTYTSGVSGTFTSGQTVTMANAVPYTQTAIAVSGTGIPNGTTATCTNQTYNCTFSNTVTLIAGQLIFSNTATLSASITGQTAGVLSTPWPYAPALMAVSGNGVTAGATAVGTQGGTAITFAPAQTITAGTLLTFQQINNFIKDSNQGYALARNTNGVGSGVTFFDLDATLSDPNDQGFYLSSPISYSFDGVHPNDIGHAAAAKAITPLFQQMIGN